MVKINNVFYKVLDGVMIIMFMSMTIFTVTNIVVRYFGSSFTWIDEISRLFFVWSSMLGIAFGYRKGAHPSFTMLLDKLEKSNANVGKWLTLFINVLIILFLGYLLLGGIEYVSNVHMQKTSILGISVSWKYSAVPIASILMLIETVKNIFLLLKKRDIKIELLE